MAILTKKTMQGPSHGNDFDRIEEKIFGHGRININRKKNIFSNDYIYIYKDNLREDDFYDVFDSEIGINKNRNNFHDSCWCNDEKNEHHEMNRFIENQDIFDLLRYTKKAKHDMEDSSIDNLILSMNDLIGDDNE